jgi:hypothetical protein
MTRPAPVLAAAHRRADLDGQFVLCRSESLVPTGWEVRRLGGWLLAAHPRLPVADIAAPSGAHAGWLAGFAIDGDGACVSGRHALAVDPTAALELEPELYRLGGRFAAIVISPTVARVYLDPAGALSCVFAPQMEMVCSTPSLIPYGMGCDDDDELVRATGVPYNKTVLGFGLTPRRGVERLVPNHYLDLATWKTHRHWPLAPVRGDRDPEQSVRIASDVAARQVRAYAAAMPYVALTAGYDSRCVLACAREFVDKIELLTLAIPDASGALDVATAGRIARSFGLRHRVVPYVEPTPGQMEDWLWRTGFSVSEPRGWNATGMYARLDPARPEIAGVAGEAARAVFWRDLRASAGVTPASVLRAMELPDTPFFNARAAAWLESLPAERPMQVVDLFYIEQRLGSWAGILPYGEAHTVALRLYPFVHRDALDAMLGLPDEYKLSKRFAVDLIRQRWPELLRIPFNREPMLRYLVRKARRRVWLMRRALAGQKSGG